jgi:hypothetical protein
MSDLEIAFCRKDEIGQLMEFIDRHWGRGHVLSRSKSLMDWQHYDEKLGRYNFALAKTRKSSSILGMLGFIPTARYDEKISEQSNVVWLVNWKVIEGAGYAGLGLSLMNFVEKNTPWQAIGTVGNNDLVAPVYRAFGYQTGKLKHYYILNRKKISFHLVSGAEVSERPSETSSGRRKLREVGENDFSELRRIAYDTDECSVPRKSADYFEKRYLRHPFYGYKVYMVGASGEWEGILVIRPVEWKGSVALRLVEYFGPNSALEGLGDEFQCLLDDHDAEYLDFYNHGIDPAQMRRAGFSERTTEGEVVIPNHFEPFEFKNVEINFAIKVSEEIRGKAQVRLFKGDADQDRPNIDLSLNNAIVS